MYQSFVLRLYLPVVTGELPEFCTDIDSTLHAKDVLSIILLSNFTSIATTHATVHAQGWSTTSWMVIIASVSSKCRTNFSIPFNEIGLFQPFSPFSEQKFHYTAVVDSPFL